MKRVFNETYVAVGRSAGKNERKNENFVHHGEWGASSWMRLKVLRVANDHRKLGA